MRHSCIFQKAVQLNQLIPKPDIGWIFRRPAEGRTHAVAPSIMVYMMLIPR